MKRYLNTKLFGQRETVDELDSKDFESMKADSGNCIGHNVSVVRNEKS